MRHYCLLLFLACCLAFAPNSHAYYPSPGVPGIKPTAGYPRRLKGNDPGFLRPSAYEEAARQAIREKFQGKFPLYNYKTGPFISIFVADTRPPTEMVQVMLSATITPNGGGMIGRTVLVTQNYRDRLSIITVTMRKDLSKVYLDFSRSGFL